MKLNKKGFTLIELLAVIVVLSIILAIAIPKITNTIKTSKDGAFKDSVKIIMNVARDYAIKNQLPNGTYKIEESPNGEGYPWLEFKGKEKYTGEWKWEDSKISIISIIDTTSNQYLADLDSTNINTTNVVTLYTIQNGKDGITINNNGTSIASKTYSSTLVGYTGVSKNIKIPSGITSIGGYSFYKSELSNVIIPNSVKTIGTYAFRNNQLTSVKIPSSVTSIGSNAFGYNQLTSITIPNSVTSIGSSAFESNQITSVTIPDSVTSIGNSAFNNNKLTSVIIPSSVTSIAYGAFGSNKLTSITIPDSVTSLAGFNRNNLTSVSIPGFVTSIGNSAFDSNILTSIIIPSSVTSIGASAFFCNQIISVIIPSSVTSIGTDAFKYNPLTTIKNETGKNFNWKSILGASSCTMTTGESNDNFITGSCNYSYSVISYRGYTGSGTVNITN